jgi:putative peptidoglycan lipid II flippase
VTVFTNAQSLYLLPGTLFGMSVAAAELPAMARLHGRDRRGGRAPARRLTAGLRRIAFFIVPSAVAFLALGRRDRRAPCSATAASHPDDVRWVWGTLAGSAVGLLASTLGRLYSSTFYALRETRTPLRFAVVRVALTLGLGYVGARYAPAWLGLSPEVGHRRADGHRRPRRVGRVRPAPPRAQSRHRRDGVPAVALAKLWGAAGAAAAVGCRREAGERRAPTPRARPARARRVRRRPTSARRPHWARARARRSSPACAGGSAA